MIKNELPGISLFNLTGKSAIVTGGTKGLGFAMAAGLASAGAEVMLVSRNAEEGDDAASRLSFEYSAHVTSFSADVTVEWQAQQMAEAAMERFGKIDILINSAGVNIRGPIDEISPAEFSHVMNVNVNGTWLASRAVVPFMKKSGNGRIINLGSALGLIGLANRTPYTASKGAVIQMTRTLGLELAPYNILVNVICPGPFLTEMNVPIADTEETKTKILGATALKRWGQLKEIQGAAIFLASDASGYMTGSVLSVDGGWTAG
jgi:NAD(P)-dependent dehydrogenase (short-subunit alcohol dehydrogenase family)